LEQTEGETKEKWREVKISGVGSLLHKTDGRDEDYVSKPIPANRPTGIIPVYYVVVVNVIEGSGTFDDDVP